MIVGTVHRNGIGPATFKGLQAGVATIPRAVGDLVQQITGVVFGTGPAGIGDPVRRPLATFDGGLHVHGACLDPGWHSLRHVLEGPEALYRLYSVLAPTDIPFAQDALGDQFILRQGIVHRLAAETGDLEALRLQVERSEAAEKWNRARLSSTQLCEYYLGSVEMTELEREARAGALDPDAVRAVLEAAGPPDMRESNVSQMDAGEYSLERFGSAADYHRYVLEGLVEDDDVLEEVKLGAFLGDDAFVEAHTTGWDEVLAGVMDQDAGDLAAPLERLEAPGHLDETTTLALMRDVDAIKRRMGGA